MTARRRFIIMWHCVSLAGELDAFNLNLRKCLLPPNRRGRHRQFATQNSFMYGIFSPAQCLSSIPDFIIICVLAPRRRQTYRIDGTVSARSPLSVAIGARLPYFVKYEMLLIKRYAVPSTTWTCARWTVWYMLLCDGDGLPYILMGRNDFFFAMYFLIHLDVPIGRLILNCGVLVYFLLMSFARDFFSSCGNKVNYFFCINRNFFE